VNWPPIEGIASSVELPAGIRIGNLKKAEAGTLADAIAQWHPDIAVGGGCCYLDGDFYSDQVYFDGGPDRNIYVGIFKHADKLVGMWSWEKEPDSLSLYCRLLIVAPEFRSARLASHVLPLSEYVSRKMGAEFFFGLATLKIPHMQRACEAAGWQLIGFTSGYDQEQIAPGVVKRVFEAVYCKVLVPSHELARPDPKNLTPRARALFDFLFPANADEPPEARNRGAE
jgi:hypothetical protein